MKRHCLALFCLVVFLAGIIAGCSGSPGAPGQSSTGSSSDKTAPDKTTQDKPVHLVFLTALDVDTEGQDPNDNYYIDYIRKATNLDIEIISAATKYEEKLNTMMASGQLPDYFMLKGTNSRLDLARWASEKMIVPLDQYLSNAPELTSSVGKTTWELTKIDNQTYALPMQRYDATPYLGFVRKDWVENLGIDTDGVRTVNDWYNMLKRFVTDDPDKNGANDTYGIVAFQGDMQPISFFRDAFNAAQDQFIDGELRPYYITEGYKNWLKFMNKLYSEKILDPEYIVTSSTQMWEKVAGGKYGSFMWFWALQEYLSKGLDRADLIAMKPPLREDGTQSQLIYQSPMRHMIAVTKTCQHPELVVKLMNWACTKEGGVFIHAGVEGVDYDLQDGKIVMKNDRKGKNLAWRYFTLGVIQPNINQEPLEDIFLQNFGQQGLEHMNLSAEVGGYNMLSMLCPPFQELAQYDLDNKPVLEFLDRAITGQINIDAEWDKYVSDWRRAGGDIKIKLSTEWYQKSYKK